MMKFLRSQSQTVLVLVLAFIAFGFLFYGNAGNFINIGSARTSNDYGRINGEDLTVAQLYDAVREARDDVIIHGGSSELQQPGMSVRVARSAWAQLLLQAEADRLHINIGTDEVADFIRKDPLFQKDGVFDLATYNDRMKILQLLMHVTPEAGTDPINATKQLFENLIRDSLREQAVQEALFNSVRTSAQDITEQYAQGYSPTTVSYAVFDPKTFATQVHVTPADIENEYKSHPTNPAYRTAEKRKVDYVLFMLPPDQQKLPDDQKQAAKDALGQKALNFILEFQPNPSAEPGTPAPNLDFLAQAGKENLAPGTTDFFAADQPPAGVPPSSAFNQAAFALSKDDAISKPIEMENGIAVLHLAEIQPSELRPLDEVKDGIQKELLAKMTQDAAHSGAQIDALLLQNALAKGTSFDKAVAAINTKAVTLPAFVPAKAMNDSKIGEFAYQAMQLKDNELSKPFAVPGSDAIAVLHVDSRAKPDPAGLADFEKERRAQEDYQLRDAVLNDWVNWKSRQPGNRLPPQLDAYGTVE
jgi:peptidyl-prolyl cis-trans isomerase D